jgi:hypothetical protein
MIKGGLDLTLNDHSVAMYERRMHLVVWRSYALQVVACVSGALIAWCAALVFNYAFRDREHARKVLEILMQDGIGHAER